MAQIHIDRFFSSEADKIWQILTDLEISSSPNKNIKILEQGNNEENGAGQIREIKINGIILKEKILKVDPPESIEYKLLSGVPAHDYYGIIILLPEKEGTTVRWINTFKPNFPWPEWLLKRKIRKMIFRLLNRIENVSMRQKEPTLKGVS